MAEFRALRSVALLLAAWAGGRALVTGSDQADPDPVVASAPEVSAPSRQNLPERHADVAETRPLRALTSNGKQLRAFPRRAADLVARPRSGLAVLPMPSSQLAVQSIASLPATQSAASGRETPAIRSFPGVPQSRLSQGWSLSSWALWRDGRSAVPLAPGQLAGSQAGLRVVAPSLLSSGRTNLAPAFRVSSALSPVRQLEGALSVIASHRGSSGRIEAFVERRFSIARGARNAFGAGIAGGGELTLVAPGITLRGYGQSGIVGLRSRDLYIDGALSADRRLYSSPHIDVAVGAGAWGGAQPGVSRIDTGPFAAITTRTAGLPIRATVGWRSRIAGNAAPGSGPVVTVGADF